MCHASDLWCLRCSCHSIVIHVFFSQTSRSLVLHQVEVCLQFVHANIPSLGFCEDPTIEEPVFSLHDYAANSFRLSLLSINPGFKVPTTTIVDLTTVLAVIVTVTLPTNIDVIIEDDPTVISFIHVRKDVNDNANCVNGGTDSDERMSRYALQSASLYSYFYLFKVYELANSICEIVATYSTHGKLAS